MTIPKGTSEMPDSQWEVYKVILPAKLFSIKGDDLYSVYFTSLVLLLHLNSWRNNCPWQILYGICVSKRARHFMMTQTAQ